jgi:hypothetical protein
MKRFDRLNGPMDCRVKPGNDEWDGFARGVIYRAPE